MFTFTELKQAGLINNLMIVHHVYDKIIPLEHVCKCLFGVKNIPITTCIIKLELDDIIINYNDSYYIKTSRFGHFLDSIGCLDKYVDKYLIINYCNFLGTEIIGIQKDIYNFNMKFIEYLEKDKPIHYITIVKMIGKEHCNGMMAGYEKGFNIMMIKYDNFYISYGYDIMENQMYVPLSQINKSIFKKLAEDIFQSMLRTNVDEYVIYNLTKITGNDSFAKMLVHSHNNMNHIIPLDIVSSVIAFKGAKEKKHYNIKFMTLYKSGTIWDKIDNDIMLNFEGLNRYYLNLDDTIIDNKEEVNTLYYDITNELIISYKTFYNQIKSS
jgi:hypothetical protein